MVLQGSGAQGAANPNPESIEQPSLFDRIGKLARGTEPFEGGDLSWLDRLAREAIASAGSAEGSLFGVSAHFFDDRQTLERLAKQNDLPQTMRRCCPCVDQSVYDSFRSELAASRRCAIRLCRDPNGAGKASPDALLIPLRQYGTNIGSGRRRPVSMTRGYTVARTSRRLRSCRCKNRADPAM